MARDRVDAPILTMADACDVAAGEGNSNGWRMCEDRRGEYVWLNIPAVLAAKLGRYLQHCLANDVALIGRSLTHSAGHCDAVRRRIRQEVEALKLPPSIDGPRYVLDAEYRSRYDLSNG